MSIALWTAQILLALAIGAAGFTKLKDSREVYANARPPMTTFAAHMPTWLFKALGVVEIAAAIGLILPWATGIASILTPIAATGVLVIMVLAFADHARRKETQAYPVNVILGAIALFVALGRFLGW
ncbi:DoxX family protein [Demequina sp. B12]|uniref:DoxX family protein n=1 Tax=Demequina sp. B12 TaxID=2992757 RepID=UPI00237B8CF0|nr:DoxX family protein [Demequina sp. B12]MDE0572192.1 DoxX family protein [Demequina sp. B12]